MSQRVADCSAPTYASDVLVCENAELRDDDRRLASLYALAVDGERDRKPLLESDGDWFNRRSRCAFSGNQPGCLAAAYQERLAVVWALLAVRGHAMPMAVDCGANHWRGSPLRTVAGLSAIVLADAEALPVGVALSSAGGPSWPVFLAHDWREGTAEVTLSGSGGTLRCVLSTTLRPLDDRALRARAEAIDRRLVTARHAKDRGGIDERTYITALRSLRDEELAIHAEARLRTYSDPVVRNYWHRSRLKFPTATESELGRAAGPPLN